MGDLDYHLQSFKLQSAFGGVHVFTDAIIYLVSPYFLEFDLS